MKPYYTMFMLVLFWSSAAYSQDDGSGSADCGGSYGNQNGGHGDANAGDSTASNISIECLGFNKQNNICDSVCNGEASVEPTTGVSPYIYYWNTGATDSVITGICAGVYSCTVTDFMGDTGTVSITIIDSNFVNTGTVAGPAAVYSGDTATYTVNNNIGSYYTWSASGGTIISGISTYQVTVVWGPAGMGTISTYEVDSNFCVGDIESLNVVIGVNSNLEEEQEQHQTAAIYPNPFTESTLIEFENTAGTSFELRVLDLSGKLIRERSAITGTRFVFRRDGMANGIYFLELRSKDQVFLGKLVLE
ncbi:MAG TPA: T9SS type A sorting domain-containing protein [Flavobacteriales bacterium]|nr:T9SS type A sorting domain-containing protein [Flavobacteriales bacterium]